MTHFTIIINVFINKVALSSQLESVLGGTPATTTFEDTNEDDL